MTRAAVKTMGATFGITGGTVIPNLTDVSHSGTSGNLMDTTNLGSASGFKTYLTSGVFEPGEMSISFNWDPSDATHALLVTNWQAGTLNSYTFTFGDATDTYIANMIPTSFDWSNSLSDDGKVEATVTFKITGPAVGDPS